MQDACDNHDTIAAAILNTVAMVGQGFPGCNGSIVPL